MHSGQAPSVIRWSSGTPLALFDLTDQLRSWMRRPAAAHPAIGLYSLRRKFNGFTYCPFWGGVLYGGPVLVSAYQRLLPAALLCHVEEVSESK